MYRKSLLYTLMMTYPAGGLKVGLVFIYIHTLCARSESSGETLKMRRLIGFAVTNSHVLTDKLYKHTSSLFGPVDDTGYLHL